MTAAIAFLNDQGDAGKAVVAMINSITYVAPGAAQSLYNNGNATFIGGGALNNLVGAATSISQPATVLLDKNHCGHDFQCLIDEFPDALTSGDPCSKPVIVNQGSRYIFSPLTGGFDRFYFLNLMIRQIQQRTSVTSTFKPL